MGSMKTIQQFFCWLVLALLLPFIMLAAVLTGALLTVVMTVAIYGWLIAEAARWVWLSARKLFFAKGFVKAVRPVGQPHPSVPGRGGLPEEFTSAVANERRAAHRKWLQ
jgi:hypothetical protein